MCEFFAFRMQFKWLNCPRRGGRVCEARGGKSIAALWPCPASLHLVTLASQLQARAHCVYVTLPLAHVNANPLNCLSALFCICRRCPCVPSVWQPNERSRTAAFSHSPLSPSPSALLCEWLAAVARLPLEAKQETEITLQTLCSTFSRARGKRGVYVTRKSSEVGLAYLLACSLSLALPAILFTSFSYAILAI